MHRNLYGVCPVHRPERKIISRNRTKIKDNAENACPHGRGRNRNGKCRGLMHWAMSAVLPLRAKGASVLVKNGPSYAALGFAMSLR